MLSSSCFKHRSAQSKNMQEKTEEHHLMPYVNENGEIVHQIKLVKLLLMLGTLAQKLSIRRRTYMIKRYETNFKQLLALCKSIRNKLMRPTFSPQVMG